MGSKMCIVECVSWDPKETSLRYVTRVPKDTSVGCVTWVPKDIL
jgi:hypothetical protein